MKPFHKKVTVKLSISLGIIAVLVLGIIFFGFRVDSLSEKVITTRQELGERSRSLQSLASLRSDYSTKGQSYLNVLYNVIPEKDELIDLSKNFQVIAQEGQLDYGFTFLGENPPIAENLGSVKFSLSLGGSLNELLSFLKNLENFRYLISLENVSLNRADRMRMNIRGDVFYR